MNILLTCGGRRNYLLSYFRDALDGTGLVCAADASADAPAMLEADRAFVVPAVHAPGYLDALLAICRDHAIGMLVSLNDLELPILARHREALAELGTRAIVSSPAVIDLCFDKWATHRFLTDRGFGSPRTYPTLDAAREALDAGDLELPVVVKPRWGTASIGYEVPATAEELELAWRLGAFRLRRSMLAQVSARDPGGGLVIQERLLGDEFGLDVINDLEGRYVATLVKQKLGMRAGETDKAITVSHPVLEALGRQIGEALGHVGNLDCDVFVRGDDIRVLEMNPRFGGGYPFSHEAGANVPAALLAWVRGAEPAASWLEVIPGVRSSKCDRLVRSGRVGSAPAPEQGAPAVAHPTGA
jgi:carbamoyl-phosphate synthase large subunit